MNREIVDLYNKKFPENELLPDVYKNQISFKIPRIKISEKKVLYELLGSEERIYNLHKRTGIRIENDSIFELNASILNLTEVPESIRELSSLKFLGLYQNRLEKFPKGILKLKNLEGLYIQENKIGHITRGIIKLKNLKKIEIYGNQLNKESREFCQELMNKGIITSF